jgi:hypothetical protein
MPISAASILGAILEFHFLRQHPTFNSKVDFLEDIRLNIASNLSAWMQSPDYRPNLLSLDSLNT